jgi:hypothetical protein
MNHIDVPGTILALPIMAMEVWYWGKPVTGRPRAMLRFEGMLFLGLLALIALRVGRHWQWGNLYFP